MPKSLNLSSQIGPILRAELARRGETQSSLAQQLGISAAGVSNRISGATPWDINELDTVAQFLGITITDLLEQVA